MNKKTGQILLVAIVGLIGVLSTNAQQMNLEGFVYKGNTLKQGESLKSGEGLMSSAKGFVAILQQDGNFCVYRVDTKNRQRGDYVKCTDTNAGATLTMQEDGNLVLYNSEGGHLWSTDTYRGDENKKGFSVMMRDHGILTLDNKAGQTIKKFNETESDL